MTQASSQPQPINPIGSIPNISNAVLAKDSKDTSHVIWNQNGYIYHAIYNNNLNQWIGGETIANIPSGFNLKLAKSGSGMQATWVSGQGNEKEAYYSIGTVDAFGRWNWSTPNQLSNDEVADQGLATIALDDENVLVVTQKSDKNNPDADTDLYSYIISSQPQDLTYNYDSDRPFVAKTLKVENSTNNSDGSFSFDAPFNGTFSSTYKIELEPLEGLEEYKNELEIVLSAIGSVNAVTGSPSEESELEVEISLFNEIINIKGLLEAGFTFGISDDGEQNWDAVELGGELEATLLLKIPVYTVSVEPLGQATVSIEVNFQLEWEFSENLASFAQESNPLTDIIQLVNQNGEPATSSDDPSELTVSMNIDQFFSYLFENLSSTTQTEDFEQSLTFLAGLGIDGDITLFDGGIEADLSGLVNANIEVEPNQSLLGLQEIFNYSFSIGPFKVSGSIEFDENFGATQSNSNFFYDPIRGTTTDYGSSAVLGDSDLTNDGVPVLALGDNNETLMAFVKDAPNETKDLTNVVVSQYIDGEWQPAQKIPGSSGINSNPLIEFDPQNQPVVIWTNANADSVTNIPPGEVYIFLGSQQYNQGDEYNPYDLGDVSTFNFMSIIQIVGGELLDQTGWSVSGAGDVNGDGLDDFIIGAPNAKSQNGKAYVMFGQHWDGFTSIIFDVDNFDGTNGFALEGDNLSQAGFSVFGADINGDGYGDLIIGSPSALSSVNNEQVETGKVYVLYGKDTTQSPFESAIKLNDIGNSQGGFQIKTKEYPQGNIGTQVGSFGDVNDDGYNDIIISSPGLNGGTGQINILFGWNERPDTILLEEMEAKYWGRNIINSQSANNGVQSSSLQTVSLIGDVNGDHITDFIIGSNGQAYLIFGSKDFNTGTNLDLAKLEQGQGVIFQSDSNISLATLQVGYAGDMNGDGINEIVLGVTSTTINNQNVPSQSFVVFGSESLDNELTFNLDSLDGSNGFSVQGAGASVNSGDINGDSYRDLILGAPETTVDNNVNAGASYIIYGDPFGYEWTNGVVNVSELQTIGSERGMTIFGAESDQAFGTSVSGLGDINGDGIQDFAIGAPNILNIDALQEDVQNGKLKYSIGTLNDSGEYTWGDATQVPGVEGIVGKATSYQKNSGELVIAWISPNSEDDKQKIYAAIWNGSEWENPVLVNSGPINPNIPPTLHEVGDEKNLILMWTQTVNDPNSPDSSGGFDSNVVSRIHYSIFDQKTEQWSNSSVLEATLDPLFAYGNSSTGVSGNTILAIPQNNNAVSFIDVESAQAPEDDSVMVFQINRSGDISQPLTLNYKTLDSTATEGSDYEKAQGLITFAPGETTKEITVNLINDDYYEGKPETFRLILNSDSLQAYPLVGQYAVDQNATVEATGTIIDDEPTALKYIDAGFIVNGENGGNVGVSLSSAGDVNNDGYDDFLIGATGVNNGVVYLVYGAAQVDVTDENLNLDQLDGNNGTILNGTVSGLLTGNSLAYSDNNSFIAVGAPGVATNPNAKPGQVYTLSYSNIAKQDSVDLNSDNSLVLSAGQDGDQLGDAIAVGDVNGDGEDDLVIGATGKGLVYVVFNKALSETGTFALNNLNGDNGYILKNGDISTGFSVAVGDVNNDNIEDIIIGAPQTNAIKNKSGSTIGNGGEVYVVFGGGSVGKNGVVDLSQLDGSNGVLLKGEATIISNSDSNPVENIPSNPYPDVAYTDQAGSSVSLAGDINNDGYQDIIIGAPTASLNQNRSLGKAYVVFGGDSDYWNRVDENGFDLTTLNNNTDNSISGLFLQGVADKGGAGFSVAGAGDVNQDGIDDLLVGAPNAYANAGQGYILFGSSEITELGVNGSNTFQLDSQQNNSRIMDLNGNLLPVDVNNAQINSGYTGTVISSAGDVNGDKIPDMLISAPNNGTDGSDLTNTYILYGKAWMGGGQSFDLTKLRSSLGFIIPFGSQVSPYSVNNAGDVNGDGYDDVLVGTTSANFNSIGKLVFGGAANTVHTSVALLNVYEGYPFPLSNYVKGVGDINEDGYADFVINNLLATNLFFGSPQITNPVGEYDDYMTLVSNDNNNNGAFYQPTVFTSADGIGDFNGDGYSDLIVGSLLTQETNSGNYQLNTTSTNTIFLGGESSTLSSIEIIGNFPNLAIQDVHELSISVAGIGDVNGDGYDDVALFGLNNSSSYGFYILFGNSSPSQSINLDQLNGDNGVKVTTGNIEDPNTPVQGAGYGDFNGDGYNDIAISVYEFQGAIGNQNRVSKLTYIIYGGDQFNNLSSGTLSLPSSTPFTSYVTNLSIGESFGSAETVTLASPGDINSDGYDDLIIGNSLYNASGTPYANVFFGSSNGLNGDNGFEIQGFEVNYSGIPITAGTPVGGGGDVNGDGFADMMMGSDVSTANNGYALYGGDFTGELTQRGTADNDILQADYVATSDNPVIMNALEGDDYLEAVGGTVVMYGALGNDIISIGDFNFHRIDGGSGVDTLLLNPYLISEKTLNLKDIPNNSLKNIEVIDLGIDNTLVVNTRSVYDITNQVLSINNQSYSHVLTVTGLAGTVQADGNWINQGTYTDSNQNTYNIYTSLTSTLLVADQLNFNFDSSTRVIINASSFSDGEIITPPNPDTATKFIADNRDNIFEPSSASDLFNLTGGGTNTIQGTLAELNEDIIEGFDRTDKIIIEDNIFNADQVKFSLGSAILDIDSNNDGNTDSTITLEGDFSNALFIIEQGENGTEISYDILNTSMYRFQNTDVPNAYLFAGEVESQNIRDNYPNFIEEGFAFNVANEDDNLMKINRFQNMNIPGAYLFAGEVESQNIRANYSNFKEEGIAFYAATPGSSTGESIYRFQSLLNPGSYIFVGSEERQSIIDNYSNAFVEEGIAFEVIS
ncbi:Calx-beta domain-containing protein [Cyanobacterium sp. DS4]|uniref:Calx-beta domain-containing protein n=1 Tax=Cyanobacterium sp. DS4 TaxID=2878255 RepID=UPI002E80E9AC|nr:Calx-beta domain-containing protein [Cyanobacterium sp. Dongsha4]WVK99267.1 hypothetical protein Dongsha4_11250 [Cyanobacterium sp. Dongsha4]